MASTENGEMLLGYEYDFALAAITVGLMLSNSSLAKAYIVNARSKVRGDERATWARQREAARNSFYGFTLGLYRLFLRRVTNNV